MIIGFESLVNSEGSKTTVDRICAAKWFESLVNSEGSKTCLCYAHIHADESKECKNGIKYEEE